MIIIVNTTDRYIGAPELLLSTLPLQLDIYWLPLLWSLGFVLKRILPKLLRLTRSLFPPYDTMLVQHLLSIWVTLIPFQHALFRWYFTFSLIRHVYYIKLHTKIVLLHRITRDEYFSDKSQNGVPMISLPLISLVLIWEISFPHLLCF